MEKEIGKPTIRKRVLKRRGEELNVSDSDNRGNTTTGNTTTGNESNGTTGSDTGRDTLTNNNEPEFVGDSTVNSQVNSSSSDGVITESTEPDRISESADSGSGSRGDDRGRGSGRRGRKRRIDRTAEGREEGRTTEGKETQRTVRTPDLVTYEQLFDNEEKKGLKRGEISAKVFTKLFNLPALALGEHWKLDELEARALAEDWAECYRTLPKGVLKSKAVLFFKNAWPWLSIAGTMGLILYPRYILTKAKIDEYNRNRETFYPKQGQPGGVYKGSDNNSNDANGKGSAPKSDERAYIESLFNPS